MKKTGSKTGPKPRPIAERFWDKVGPHDDPTKCWLWTASTIKSRGKLRYGTFGVGDRQVLAHRFSYEMHYHVIIPDGMTIDHVKARGCTSTLCVNPHHLEVVTLKVNVLRGETFASNKANQICCIHGHSFNEENTYVRPNGSRCCRVCMRARQNKAYHMKKKALS